MSELPPAIKNFLSAPYFFYLTFSLIIQTIGAIGAKYMVTNLQEFHVMAIPGSMVFAMFLLGTMGLQAIVWQKALIFYPLSLAYPFRSLVNFTVLISAFIFFNESITALNIIGLIVTSFGIYILVRDDVL
jgi:drug/metabolite transporter (DMT)-like permease